MYKLIRFLLVLIALVFLSQCHTPVKNPAEVTAADILGNPDCPAICYGGFRHLTRDTVPSVEEISEDLRILSAMGIRIVRTYNTQQFAHAERLLEAIHQMKEKDPKFEMYVMLGAWIDCEGAWTGTVNHEDEDTLNNTAEIEAAVRLAGEYPGIVKVIAVGNEAMVHWASSYFVRPRVILKYVEYLQQLKSEGKIPAGTWITSSDNFASWGGGDDSYYRDDLTELMKAVDFISVHTYPFQDSHYNPGFWRVPPDETELPARVETDSAMVRAFRLAVSQYEAVRSYMEGLGIKKPVHMGETGWATVATGITGPQGSAAADEYKQMLYYDQLRNWSRRNGVSCFFFEAFDEPWKDDRDPWGPENHFGIFTLNGKAKRVLWEEVDKGTFTALTRGGFPVEKTFGGNSDSLMETVVPPPPANE